MCAKCECKKKLLQKCDKNITRSWQKYVPKIDVEKNENNGEFHLYLCPLSS
jgi:hypothetical protein